MGKSKICPGQKFVISRCISISNYCERPTYAKCMYEQINLKSSTSLGQVSRCQLASGSIGLEKKMWPFAQSGETHAGLAYVNMPRLNDDERCPFGWSWWCRHRQHSQHLNPLFTARTSVAEETTHFRWPGINHYCHMAASKNGGVVFLLLAYLKHDIAWWILYWSCVCVCCACLKTCMFPDLYRPVATSKPVPSVSWPSVAQGSGWHDVCPDRSMGRQSN